MKKLSLLLSLLLCLTPLFGCASTPERNASFFLMNTTVTVTLYTSNDALAEEVFEGCRSLLSELESLWARQRADSETARMNASESGVDDLDLRTVALLQKALEVSRATGGAFDITVAPAVDLWQRCGEADRLPEKDELDAILRLIGYQHLTLTEHTLIKSDPAIAVDLGGIGKGEAMTLLLDYLKTTTIVGGLVSFGSNVAVFGEKPSGKPFTVALRDPKNASGTVGSLTLSAGEVLSVSGDYERYVTVGGERYHHIVDPATGYPAQSGLSSVAVVTDDGAFADALSTALFVMGEDAAMAFYRNGGYDFEAIFVTSDGEVRVTDGLTGCWQKA